LAKASGEKSASVNFQATQSSPGGNITAHGSGANDMQMLKITSVAFAFGFQALLQTKNAQEIGSGRVRRQFSMLPG